MGGSLDDNELLFLQQRFPFFNDLKIFIETGTYKGETSRNVSKYFNDVYTFEINYDLYIQSALDSIKYQTRNIHHYLGDSVDLLNLILKLDTRPTFFFLDAHQSGSDTSNNNIELVPLISELKHINDLYSPENVAIICVDDYRLWNDEKAWDWSHITDEKIKETLNKHKITETFVHNDRLYLIINNK